MLNGKKVVVVMPAYNAAKTIEKTVRELPDIVDTTILVDDGSTDDTVRLARTLGLQYSCTTKITGMEETSKLATRALNQGADIVVMSIRTTSTRRCW